MANHVSHWLPFPVYGAAYNHYVPFVNPNNEAAAFDTELSKDNGAYADATNEVTQPDASVDNGWITLTAAEMTASVVLVKAICIASQKPTLECLKPRRLPTLLSGTAAAGGASTLRLQAGTYAAYTTDQLNGCIIRVDSGAGAGQARIVQDFNAGTGDLTVAPNWETNTDNTSVYSLLTCELSANLGGGGGGSSLTAQQVWEYDIAAIVAANLAATVLKARSSQTSVDTLATYVDTEVAAIKAKTDNLPADPASQTSIDGSFAIISAQLTTVAGYVDTEVAAIKAKTDNLPADPADASDIAAAFATVNGTLSTIAGYIDTEVAAILAKVNALPTDPADQSAVEAAITASVTSTAAAVWATDIEAGVTALNAMRADLAMLTGLISTAGQNPEIFQNPAGTKDRVTINNDNDGNRSAVTFDFT